MIHESWKPYLQKEFQEPYFQNLSQFLHQAYSNKVIYPSKKQVFSAFSYPFSTVKVVILGQDPYHGAGQAHGLAFSVAEKVAFPPSLQNIFKEIQTDVGAPIPRSGNLDRWARQGVLLLNASLTVEANKAGSHRGRGWEEFTTKIIKILSRDRDHLVFLLWGRDARSKKNLIDLQKHLVLEAAHPSPLSAYNGFFGCHHFSQTNAYLEKTGQKPIIW